MAKHIPTAQELEFMKMLTTLETEKLASEIQTLNTILNDIDFQRKGYKRMKVMMDAELNSRHE